MTIKHLTLKKITLTLFIFTILFSSTTQKSYAIFGIGDVVTDPGNTVQGVLQVAEGTTQSFLQNSLNYKEFLLDALVNILAKQLINQMTTSIVNWINSGFEGNPSFITDPGGFFLDAADQVTGTMLNQNGPLASLCSPFSFDLRITLALQASSRYKQRYTCTLGKIIENTRNAVERGVTINGFMAGDFSQGGWPAFIALTTNPQDSYSSAYLYAHSDLLSRIAQKEASVNVDLNRGRGFLSYTKCEDITSNLYNSGLTGEQINQIQKPGDHNIQEMDPEKTSIRKTVDYEAGTEKIERCKVQTPGSVIEGTLSTQLGSGVRQLELADEIDEIVGALVNQLVIQIVTKGLNAASGGSSNRPSAVQQILGEQQLGAEQIRKLGKVLADKIAPYLEKDTKIINTYRQSLTITQKLESSFNEAKACWVQKNVTSKISEVDNILSTKINPLTQESQTKLTAASTTIQALIRIRQVALTATSTAQFQPASDEFTQLLQTQTLRTASDLQAAQDNLDSIKNQVEGLSAEAKQSLDECKAYKTP